MSGRPSFLKVLLDRAASEGTDISSLQKALVGAEALPSALRAEFRSRGISVLQCYGTADIGVIAYESIEPGREGVRRHGARRRGHPRTRPARHRRAGSCRARSARSS